LKKDSKTMPIYSTKEQGVDAVGKGMNDFIKIFFRADSYLNPFL